MKRFTETFKWRDPWYLELSLQAKAVFSFITDNCDNCGVWEPNYRLVNFSLKCDIDWDTVTVELGNRIATLPNGKWWITRFCQFQYGQLNDNCAPHRAVIALAKKHGLEIDRKGNVTLTLPSNEGRERDKDKDKDKDKDTEGGAGGNETHAENPHGKLPAQLRAEKLFKRRPTTAWDESCKKAWEKSKASIAETTEDDWKLLEWFYSIKSEGTYRRLDLPTLLNNWTAEIDRARNFRANGKPAEKQRVPENLRLQPQLPL